MSALWSHETSKGSTEQTRVREAEVGVGEPFLFTTTPPPSARGRTECIPHSM